MNLAASIRAKLQTLAKTEGVAFQLIIFRYFHERLLYRLAQSNYTNNFLLKGGALLYALDQSKTRPTKDIDLLGNRISSKKEDLEQIFIEILSISYIDDAVLFNTQSITTEYITEQKQYSGVRLFVEARLDSIKQRLQLDIGFGDIVTPKSQDIEFPVLLGNISAPLIKAYSIESVIAEKFQAMIELSGLNSRMKDFYDVYKLLISKKYKLPVLHDAILVTFKNRNTSYIENHALFSLEFVADKERLRMWQAFLNKIKMDATLSFKIVTDIIIVNLKPIWDTLK